jgi:hypothetical protein
MAARGTGIIAGMNINPPACDDAVSLMIVRSAA